MCLIRKINCSFHKWHLISCYDEVEISLMANNCQCLIFFILGISESIIKVITWSLCKDDNFLVMSANFSCFSLCQFDLDTNSSLFQAHSNPGLNHAQNRSITCRLGFQYVPSLMKPLVYKEHDKNNYSELHIRYYNSIQIYETRMWC